MSLQILSPQIVLRFVFWFVVPWDFAASAEGMDMIRIRDNIRDSKSNWFVATDKKVGINYKSMIVIFIRLQIF
jgi:hypothetical protein